MTGEAVPKQRKRGAVRVVCVGETMLMFAPPRYELIEHCVQFVSYSGGAESNVAMGLARLGVPAGWIGKLPRNALGRKVVNEIRAYGVDTSAVIWAEEGRVGTFFVEWGAHPRPLMTIYDRANSAATTMVADDLDWDYVAGAQWLHLTGITPALSATCRASTREIAARARALGLKVSFDVNYRSLLWNEEEARLACQEILPFVSLLITTESDAAMLLAADLGREEALRRMFQDRSHEAVVMTLGGEGSMAYDGERVYTSPGRSVEVVNRLGAGDAFDAGLLFGYLGSGLHLQAGLDYGGAMAALKMTIPQNTPLINREDLDRLLSGGSLDLLR